MDFAQVEISMDFASTAYDAFERTQARRKDRQRRLDERAVDSHQLAERPPRPRSDPSSQNAIYAEEMARVAARAATTRTAFGRSAR